MIFKAIDDGFRGTLMGHGFVLMVILTGLVIAGAEKAWGYTGASIYTMLTAVTLVRKYKELTS